MNDGRTAREHVRAYARRSPVDGAAMLADVTPEDVPIGTEIAVEAFELLSATRGSSMSGPRALALDDIARIGDVIGTPLTVRECRFVHEQDREFLKIAAEMMSDG